MNTWRWTGSAIVNFSKRSRFPRYASDLKWKKEDRKGGRKEKGDRTRDESYWRGTINTQTYMFQKKHVFIIKQLLIRVTIVSFITKK